MCQLFTVEPVKEFENLAKGDIVLGKVNGNEYLHLIKAIQGARFKIGNNRGRINDRGRLERDFRKVHKDCRLRSFEN